MAEQFSAAPKVVKPKNKYKQQPEEQEEEEIKLIYNNLMWDKRIFRGNTYSAIVVSKKGDNPNESQYKIPIRTQKPQEITDSFDGNKRANIQIFTDQFVQSLTDKPPRYEYGSQTDPLADKKVIRHRIHKKEGADIETQIWDNELFDFDYEVESLLNVLCGRTLQIGRMEVLQEEELKIMANRQQQLRLYEKEQNKKIQGMYNQEDQLQQQNLKTIQNFKKEKEKKIKTHKKVFARVIAKQYFKGLKQNTFSIIEAHGFFKSIVDSRLIAEVLPKLYQDVSTLSQQQNQYAQDAQKILTHAQQVIIKEHAWAKEVERTRRQTIIEKRQERAREKQERRHMNQEERYMVKYLAEEKVFLEQQQLRKREEQARQQGAEIKIE